MNKKLIALAVAGAMMAPAASMAAVTVYGQVHVSVNALGGVGSADTSSGQNNKAIGVTDNVSRIGFKGMEALGGGMTAFFNGAWQVDWTNSRNKFDALQTIVGLKGGFGAISVGRHEGPLKVFGRKTDLFSNTAADSRALTSHANTDARLAQSVVYATPNMSGVTGILGYTGGTNFAGEGVNPAQKKHAGWTAAINYHNGPIWGGFAYEHVDKALIGTAADSALKDWRIAGSYKMGALKFLAQFGQSKGMGTNTAGGNSGTKRNDWNIGASYAMGMNVLKVQYVSLGKCKGCATEANTKADMWALGVDHKMSKSFKVYALYTKINNNSNMNASFGGGFGARVGVLDGKDPSAFSVGMQYKF